MPPFRQDLSGVKDDGTLVGKGGKTQKLGAAATRRLASGVQGATKPKPQTDILTTDQPVSKPVERPPRPAPPGFRMPSGDGTVMTDGAPPAPSPAAGVSGASPEILQRMEQLAAERGVGGAKPMAGLPPGVVGAELAPTPEGFWTPERMAAAKPMPFPEMRDTGMGSGAPTGPMPTVDITRPPRGIPGFQLPPGVASTLPATLEAGGAPGPGPVPTGMTKPMLGARPPVGGAAAPAPGGAYDGLANIGAALRRRNPMADLGGGAGGGPGGGEMMR